MIDRALAVNVDRGHVEVGVALPVEVVEEGHAAPGVLVLPQLAGLGRSAMALVMGRAHSGTAIASLPTMTSESSSRMRLRTSGRCIFTASTTA